MRELKAAGIDFVIEKTRKKKKKELDYNAEVPFQRHAPDFIFKTGAEERPKANLSLGNISLQ
jgi:hypothetical protein